MITGVSLFTDCGTLLFADYIILLSMLLLSITMLFIILSSSDIFVSWQFYDILRSSTNLIIQAI